MTLNKKIAPLYSSSTIAQLILIIAVVTISSLNIYVPAAVTIQREFMVSAFTIKVSLLMSPITSFFCSIPVGYYADRYGRQKFYLAGMLIYMIGAAICFVAPSMGFFFLGQFFLALATGAINVLTATILADLFKGIDLAKYMGVFSSLFPAVSTLSPLLGGQILHHVGWRYIFVYLCLTMSVAAFFAWSRIPETKGAAPAQKEADAHFLVKLKVLLMDPFVFKLALANALTITVSALFTINSPFLFIEIYGFSPVTYSFLVVIPVVFQFMGAMIYRFSVPYWGPKKALKIGLYPSYITVVVTVLFMMGWIPENPYLVVATIATFSIGSSFIISSTITLLLDATTTNKGLMNSVISLVRNATLVSILLIVSYFVVDSVFPIYLAIMLIALSIIFLLRKVGKGKGIKYFLPLQRK